MGILLRNWHLKLSAILLSTVLYTGLVFSGSFTGRRDPGPRRADQASRDVFVLTGDLGFVEVDYRVSNDQAGVIAAGLRRRPSTSPRTTWTGRRSHSSCPVEVTTDLDGRRDPVGRARRRSGSRSTASRSDPCRSRSIAGRSRGPRDRRAGRQRRRGRGPRTRVGRRPGRPGGRVRRHPGVGDRRQRAGPVTPVDVRGQPVGPASSRSTRRWSRSRSTCEPVETETTVAVRPMIERHAGARLRARGDRRRAVGGHARRPAGGARRDHVITTEPISIDGLSADEDFEVELRAPGGRAPRRRRADVGHRDRDDRSVGLEPNVRRRRRVHRAPGKCVPAAARPGVGHAQRRGRGALGPQRGGPDADLDAAGWHREPTT